MLDVPKIFPHLGISFPVRNAIEAESRRRKCHPTEGMQLILLKLRSSICDIPKMGLTTHP